MPFRDIQLWRLEIVTPDVRTSVLSRAVISVKWNVGNSKNRPQATAVERRKVLEELIHNREIEFWTLGKECEEMLGE